MLSLLDTCRFYGFEDQFLQPEEGKDSRLPGRAVHSLVRNTNGIFPQITFVVLIDVTSIAKEKEILLHQFFSETILSFFGEFHT